MSLQTCFGNTSSVYLIFLLLIHREALFYISLSHADAKITYRDIVVYDYRIGKKTPLKAFMLEKFQDTWEAQEETKRRNESRVRCLLERVENLEKESWDRKGAVENFGGR